MIEKHNETGFSADDTGEYDEENDIDIIDIIDILQIILCIGLIWMGKDPIGEF